MSDESTGLGENSSPPPPNSRSWVKFGLVGSVIILALVYFVYSAFDGAPVYYYSVSEVLSESNEFDSSIIRVNGRLIPESFVRDDGTTLARFSITDGLNTLNTSYVGAVPDLFFSDRSEIIVEGSLNFDNTFVADTVIVKCPTKYEAVYNGDGNSS